MRYDVGIRPIANLENSVSVTNLTRTDGKNYVGDEIEYAVKVKSPKDNFYGIKITDELSWYFENPTAPITVVDDQGVESTYALKDVYKANTSPSATDPKVGTFTIPAGVVGGGKEITIKIKSKIAHPAAGQEIDNLANISGKSEEESLVNEDVKPDSTLLVENAAPEIIGADDFEMDKGEDFDELAGITVKDMEDGDLTSKVSVEGFVNTSKKGQYSVTYTVTDSHGNVTTKTIIVSVV
nr:immunoglobulin-like domain-containing protein [Vagococcus allomyrinae]